MPFGLGPALRIFKKIMKKIVALLKDLGVQTIIYLYDLPDCNVWSRLPVLYFNLIILNQNKTGLAKGPPLATVIADELGICYKYVFSLNMDPRKFYLCKNHHLYRTAT